MSWQGSEAAFLREEGRQFFCRTTLRFFYLSERGVIVNYQVKKQRFSVIIRKRLLRCPDLIGTPRNDITKTYSVIASEAKQSQYFLNIPRIVAKQEEGEQMMRQLKMTMCLFVSILALVFLGQVQSTAAGQMDTSQLTYNIEAQSLKSALEIYQKNSGLNLAYSDDLVQGKMTDGVDGKNTTGQALKEILKGTGLTYTVTGRGTVVLKENKIVVAQGDVEKSEEAEEKEEVKRPVEMEQMVVTATKSKMNVREIPASVNVVTPEDIEMIPNVLSFGDALEFVPGVFVNKGPGLSYMMLRGQFAAVMINGRESSRFHHNGSFPTGRT